MSKTQFDFQSATMTVVDQALRPFPSLWLLLGETFGDILALFVGYLQSSSSLLSLWISSSLDDDYGYHYNQQNDGTHQRLLQNYPDDDGQSFQLFLLGVACFFLVWNFVCAQLVVEAFRDIYQGRWCTGDTVMLLCPHWILGLIVPPAVGWSSYNWKGLLIMLSISVIPPYSLQLPCNCERRNSNNRTTSTLPTHRTGTAGSPIATRVSGLEGYNNDDSAATESRKAFLKSNLKFTKVIEQSIREDYSNFNNVGDGDGDNDDLELGKRPLDDVSYRTRFPKADLIISKRKRKNPNEGAGENKDEQGEGENDQIDKGGSKVGAIDQSVKSSVSDSGRSNIDDDYNNNNNSGLVCPICLEPYREGDTICWSSSESGCHHAFHEHCGMEWFMKHSECPVCRSPYV